MCQNAIETAIRPDEQKLALEVLTLRPSVAGLSVADEVTTGVRFKTRRDECCANDCAEIGRSGVDVQDLISSAGLAKVDLEIIEAQYGAGETKKDVTKDLRKLAGGIPLITLQSDQLQRKFRWRSNTRHRQAIEDQVQDERKRGRSILCRKRSDSTSLAELGILQKSPNATREFPWCDAVLSILSKRC